MIGKIRAKIGDKRFPSVFKLPIFATAMTPRIGNPTADIINPAIEIHVSVPEARPKKAGKIRFPAPKNIENSIKLMNTSCFLESFCIVSFLSSWCFRSIPR